MDLNKEAELNQEWVSAENYEFKILVMIACLAQEKMAFRGTLNDMCQFLGVKEYANNKNNIKQAIQRLEEKKDILVMREGHIWTLTLSVSAERKPKIIRIKNDYINTIKSYKANNPKDNVSWENILKVLVFIWDEQQEHIYTQKDIAAKANVSVSTVGRAFKALEEMPFSDIAICKKIEWYKTFEGQWRAAGTTFRVGYNWDKK